jgi:hypothetical protein
LAYSETGKQSVPDMRISNDNGVAFGPVLTLAANDTIGLLVLIQSTNECGSTVNHIMLTAESLLPAVC